MSALVLEQDFAGMLPAAPDINWGQAFDAVETLKDLERLISTFDVKATRWRANLIGSMKTVLGTVTARMAELPADQARHIVLPLLEEVFAAIEELRAAHETPLHDRPELAENMKRLDQLSGGTGRYLSTQLRRLEDIRVLQYNTAVDVYYGLLAFRSEIEGDRQTVATFSDPDAMGDFLRQQTA